MIVYKEMLVMIRKIAVATIMAFAVTVANPALATDYLGNPKSMKFHYTNCRTIKYPDRFVTLHSREAAISAGYVPCKVCNP